MRTLRELVTDESEYRLLAGSLLDVERVLLCLTHNPTARREVEDELNSAGFGHGMLDGALETMERLNGHYEPKPPSGKPELAEFVDKLMKEPAKIHPLLERELGELTLRLTLCNGNWHGELVEEGSVIWSSRGESNREAVEKAAKSFADYAKTEVIDL